MHVLPVGWATDVAVLEHAGSTVEDQGDHVVVRTSRNPTFHWGNCVLVTDPDCVDDAPRWVAVFQAVFPSATWVAIGLPRMPGETTAWGERGLELEQHEVLSTRTLPRQTPLYAGYDVRRLEGDDWDQLVARRAAEHGGTSDDERQSYERFVRARTQAQRSLSDRGIAAFFGAFMEGVLTGHLGIVRCGETARYQDVGTDGRHRRRGLASHLLGVASRWSAEHGCTRWVIVTDATNPAGRVYRNLGFEMDITMAQAYRSSPR